MKNRTNWRSVTVAVATVAIVSLGAMAFGVDKGRKTNHPGLERIKSLAGDWVKLDENGRPTDEVASSFKVTAGGSTVIDIEFAGSDHEMITMYHTDGDDLVLTHYCVLGNQPRMRADRKRDRYADSDEIVFRCIGGTNMKSENDEHMHQGTIRWVDENHIKSIWLMHENGEQTYEASFELVRRKK